MTVMTMPQPKGSFAKDILEQTAYWLREFSLAWHEEVPAKIHEGLRSLKVDGGGGPAFTREFRDYIDRPCRRKYCYDLNCNHDAEDTPKLRTTRAFRRLRREAPREFDALYLICRHGLTIPEAAAALTERAVRLDKPERYDSGGILVLVVAGVDKLVKYW